MSNPFRSRVLNRSLTRRSKIGVGAVLGAVLVAALTLVLSPAVGITNVQPQVKVEKTANPLTRPAPGGEFTFTVVVTNTGLEPVRITTLADDVYGNLNGRGTCAVGATLAANGGTYTCSFTGPFTGPAGASQTDVVTVIVVDQDGETATARDDATVSLISLTPDITVEKSASPPSLPAPGGTFTFNVVVTNTGPNALTITSLQDNIYGNLANRGTCTTAIGTVLPSGGSYSCSFPGVFTGIAGQSQTDVVTVTGVGADGTVVTDQDDATVTLTGTTATLTTQASAAVPVGGQITDTATLSGGVNPTGTITFRLFGPDNTTCAGAPIFTSVVPVNGNGGYRSDSFIPAQPGTYRWIATYSGDANNAPVGPTACADPNETVVVTPLPQIRVDKTAAPGSLPVPGGTFTFNVVVTNASNVPLTIRTLTDDVYGDISQRPGSTCNTAIGTVLAPAGTYTCSFRGDFRSNVNASQTDVVTVTATDNRGNTVRASDDATVFITSGPPSITTTKTATPSSLPAPGGTFTFTFTVLNNGPRPVTITSLVDDVYGNLNGRGTCAVGAVLAANGGTYTCSFNGNFFGNAGAAQTDTITTTVVDDQGRTATSQAVTTVTISNVPPTPSNLPPTPSGNVDVCNAGDGGDGGPGLGLGGSAVAAGGTATGGSGAGVGGAGGSGGGACNALVQR